MADLLRRVEDLEAELGHDSGEIEPDIERAQPADPASRGAPATSEAKLVASGIDEVTAEWIQGQLDRNQLDELYLQNQASREGWLNTPRYHKQRRQIHERFGALREELGDETFDRLLYAVGRPNRVRVSEVMQGSPAEQVGLNANDTILSYDGKRVFSTPELQTLTKGGDPGSWVLLELLRDGRPVSLYVQGGPLGVRLNSGRVEPE